MRKSGPGFPRRNDALTKEGASDDSPGADLPFWEIPALNAEMYDAMVAGMTVTGERKKVIDCSRACAFAMGVEGSTTASAFAGRDLKRIVEVREDDGTT